MKKAIAALLILLLIIQSAPVFAMQTEVIVTTSDDECNFSPLGWEECYDLALLGPTGEKSYTTGNENAYVDYFAKALTEGTYKTYVYCINKGSAQTDALKAEIHHNQKTDTVTIDTTALPEGSGAWVYTGTYDFSGKSDSEKINLKNSPDASYVPWRTAAVKFVSDNGEEEMNGPFAIELKPTSPVLPDEKDETPSVSEKADGTVTANGITLPLKNAYVTKIQLEILSKLGLLKDFKFDQSIKNVTRAEFVALVVKLYGVNANVSSDKTQIFADVSPDNKYFDAINTAYNLGIIKGNGAAWFNPNDSITFEQALIISVNAAGYGIRAEKTGYYAEASGIRLTEGITLSGGDYLNQSAAVRLIANLIETDIFEEKSIGSGEYKTEKETNFLSRTFKVYHTDGILNATNIVSVASNISAPDGSVVIDNEKYYCTQNLTSFVGYSVDFYYKKENSKKTVMAIDETEGRNEVVTLSSEDISNAVLNGGNLQIKCDKNGKIRNINAKLDKVIYNNVPITSFSSSDFMPTNGNLVLINNGTGAYGIVFINDFTDYVVDSADSVTEKVFSKYNGVLNLRNLGNSFKIINENGKEMPVEALKEWNVLSVPKQRGSVKPECCAIILSKASAYGKITEIVDGNYVINDVEYELTNDYKSLSLAGNENTPKLSLGDYVTVYLNKDKKITAAQISKVKATNYAYAYQINRKEGGKEKYEMKLFTSNGYWRTLDVADKVRFDGNRDKITKVVPQGFLKQWPGSTSEGGSGEGGGSEPTPSGQTVYINGTRYSGLTGNWTLSTNVNVAGPSGTPGTYYTNESNAAVTFPVPRMEQGYYDVYFWITKWGSSSNIVTDIKSDYGRITSVYDMSVETEGVRKWAKMGTALFGGSGSGESVTFRSEIDGGLIRAIGVMFVKRDDPVELNEYTVYYNNSSLASYTNSGSNAWKLSSDLILDGRRGLYSTSENSTITYTVPSYVSAGNWKVEIYDFWNALEDNSHTVSDSVEVSICGGSPIVYNASNYKQDGSGYRNFGTYSFSGNGSETIVITTRGCSSSDITGYDIVSRLGSAVKFTRETNSSVAAVEITEEGAPIWEVIYYETNENGEINLIKTLEPEEDSASRRYDDGKPQFWTPNNKYPDFWLDADTTVFGIPADKTNEEMYRLLTSEYFETYDATTEPYEFDETRKAALILVTLTDSAPSIYVNQKMFLVSKVVKGINYNDEETIVLKGYRGGMAATVTPKDSSIFANTKPGDVIITNDVVDEAIGMRLIWECDASNSYGATGGIKDYYATAFGKITGVFDGCSAVKIDLEGTDGERMYYFTRPVYYVYDTSEKTIRPGTTGDVCVGREVFIRIYAADVMEVIVYE